jgi:two-component system, cell cycle response regulator
MRRHTIIGERILSAAPALAPVAKLVRSTHERWDGAGYPDGLAGEDTPLGARVIAACDAFDAMVTERPYRPAVTHAEAVAELERCSGTQFDSRVIEAMHRVIARRLIPAGRG